MSENPYEPPRYQATLSSVTYYRPLTTKLSLREYRRISRNWFELVLCVCFKFLRIRLPSTFAFADHGSFQRIAPQELSVRAREKIKPIADQALALNLKYAFSYWLHTVGTIEGAAAVFLSEGGRSFFVIVYVRTWTRAAVSHEKATFAFVSRLANGKVIGTSGAKRELDPPPYLLGESHPGKPMQEVFERHQTRLNEAGSPVVTVHDPDQLEQLIRAYEKENFAFNVARGVYVPVSPGELARLQQLAVTTPEVPHSKAKRQFQIIEWICLIALVLGLLMFTDQPATVAQNLFRLSILFVSLAGIAIIWLIRGVAWMRRNADE